MTGVDSPGRDSRPLGARSVDSPGLRVSQGG